MIVKDKKGKYIADLKAEDFTIVENGVAQKIEFFDAPLSRTETKSPATAAAPDVTSTGPAPRNYVALVLDSQTTDITNLKQVREGTIKYVRDQITENDTVALLVGHQRFADAATIHAGQVETDRGARECSMSMPLRKTSSRKTLPRTSVRFRQS